MGWWLDVDGAAGAGRGGGTGAISRCLCSGHPGVALKGLAPGVQVGEGVASRESVVCCRRFAVSSDSCRMYASIRVSAPLGPEALAVVLALW